MNRRPTSFPKPPSAPKTIPTLSACFVGLHLSLAVSVNGATPSVPKQTAPILLRDSTIVVGNGTIGPYFVSGYFIIIGSESVRLRRTSRHNDNLTPVAAPGDGSSSPEFGTTIENTDYSLDPNKGWIRFDLPVPAGDSVTVSFVRLAFVCPTELSAGQPSATELTPGQIVPVSQVLVDGFEPPSKASPYRTKLPSPTALQWRGYKSFSVSTSSGRSADWSQGLDLAVSGEITPGLKLTAALSDRATGTSVQSGADATRLGDLDRLYIEANSARFNGRWGNLAIVDAGSGSGPATRHATGFKLGWTTPASRSAAYIGYASGELIRRTLPVKSGDAGPYRLINQAGIAVVPGSVTLTVDGNRLREGAVADYVFDPQQNAITFNPSVVLSGHSQAVVEFEQTVDSYRRLMAGGEWSLADHAGSVKLSTAAHWESDDPDRPMFGSLSEAQRNLLAQTPNSDVTIPAANFAGAHRGDYQLDISSTDSVYVYVGPNNGDWRVSFRWVGSGQGRYRHLAEAAYEYAGKGRGAYEPTATLGAPRAHADLTQSFDIGTRHLGRFDGIWSGNLDDANRLSAHSTRFLSDHRVRWSLGAQRSSLNDGAVNTPQGGRLILEWRRISSATHRTNQLDDLPRFLSLWGIRSALFDSSRNDYQLALSATQPGQLDIATEAGLLTSANLRAWRLSLASSNRIWRSLSANLMLGHRSASSGTYNAGHDQSTQYESRLIFSPRPAQLEAGWRQDRLSNRSRLFEPAPDLAMVRWVKLARGPVSTQYRWETVHDSTLLTRRTRELSLSASTDYRNSSQGRLTLARGQQSIGNRAFAPYYRGQLTESWRPTEAISFNADLRLTRGHTGSQREVYLPTLPGQGQYRLERGEYIPDLHGDYRRVIAPADDTNLDTYDGEQRLLCVWRPNALGWRWTLESQIERQAQYDPARFRPGVWILPWNAHQSAYLRNSRSQQRHRVRVAAQPGQSTELSLGWISDKAVVTGDVQLDRHDRYQFTARRHLNDACYLQGAVSQDDRKRNLAGSTALASRATTLSATLGATPAVGVSWSLEGRRRTEREETLRNSIRLWGLRPSLHSTLGPVVLSAETDATWVSSPQQGSILSALLAEGRPVGFSVTQFCELRVQLPGKITIRSNLNADLRNQGPNRWRWELETTAAF